MQQKLLWKDPKKAKTILFWKKEKAQHKNTDYFRKGEQCDRFVEKV